MRYSYQFRASAAEEFDLCCRTYGCHKMLQEWLREIAEAASQHDESQSIDALEVLEQLENSGQWRHAWRKFASASIKQQLAAILHVLRSRRPPWEFRMSLVSLAFLDGLFRREVQAYYEVEHPARRVVFTKFVGLPPGPEIDDL